MTAADDLARAGLALSGDPTTAMVEVGGHQTGVEIREADGRVTLRVAAPVPGDVSDAPVDALSLSAPGDTSFALEPGTLVGIRTLASPTVGALYDAIFDLAKGIAQASQLIGSVVEFGEDEAPTVPPPAPSAGTFWFYVNHDQDVTAASSGQTAHLVPGQAYRAEREENGWIWVVHDAGVAGWIPSAGTRRA
jgi:hypothetical protein